MKNILLVCSAGMSTSLLVSKMIKESEARGLETNIWAVGDAESSINVGKADVVLLGPQVKYLLKKITEMAGETPVEVINMMDYGTMNGAKVLDRALELIEGK